MGDGRGEASGVGSGVATGVKAGVGFGDCAFEGEGEGEREAVWELVAAVPTKGTQLTPEPAKGSQAGAPPVIQISVPGPRPNTKRASKQAMKSPKIIASGRRSLPCIRVRSG